MNKKPINSKLHGPLRRNTENGRYFTDDSGKAIYITGSHTWENFQDMRDSSNTVFNYEKYLDFMEAYNHNFIRFWTWEQAFGVPWSNDNVIVSPLPYWRTGPGMGLDGYPKFNLDEWDETYFERMRLRIIAAGERGIYASIMLFQGFSMNRENNPGDPWASHPFNRENNTQGIGAELGTIDVDGQATVHSLLNTDVVLYQEAYVRKVIDTVNDLDNVLYEIINEGGTIEWEYHMIDFIHEYEAKKPKQHPVGMTHRINPNHYNDVLYKSNADWISPIGEPMWWMIQDAVPLVDYRDNPATGDGTRVIVPDTDHLWGHGGNYKWVWKCFLRGLNPIFMDSWQPCAGKLSEGVEMPWVVLSGVGKNSPDYPDWEPIRLNMGYTRRYAQKMDLVSMKPENNLSSSQYCLANRGEEYLVYLPEGGNVTINLCDTQSEFSMEWFIPNLDRTISGGNLSGGYYRVLTAPYTGDCVVYLKRKQVEKGDCI